MPDESIYFGPGTTPERVARAVEEAKERRRDEGRRPVPSTSERERYFQRLAEERKRAGG